MRELYKELESPIDGKKCSMTIHKFKCECVHYAREHWWNGSGAVVIMFLVATFLWKRPDNDYLLYAALIVVGTHAYLSTLSFGRHRTDDRQHVEELAVAYREQLRLQEDNSHDSAVFVADRTAPRRNGSAAHSVSRSAVRLVSLASH